MNTANVRNSEGPSFQGQDQDLNETDLAILRMLDDDARRSNVDIAKMLGVSEKTVRNRLARLYERGLRFRVDFLNRRSHPLVYLIRSRPGNRFPLAERLRDHYSISRLFVTNGSADLVAICRFRDEIDQLEFEAKSLSLDPDVTDFELCSPIASLVNDVDVATRSTTAAIGGLSEEQITRTFLLLPKFRSQDEALHWLAIFLRRAYSAQYVYVTTRSEFADVSKHILAPGKATANFPLSYITELGEEMKQEKADSYTHFPLIHSMNSKKHIVVSNVKTDALLSPALKRMGIKLGYNAIVTFPMTFGAEIVGAVALYFEDEFHPDGEYLSSVQRSLDFFIVAYKRTLEQQALVPLSRAKSA